MEVLRELALFPAADKEFKKLAVQCRISILPDLWWNTVESSCFAWLEFVDSSSCISMSLSANQSLLFFLVLPKTSSDVFKVLVYDLSRWDSGEASFVQAGS